MEGNSAKKQYITRFILQYLKKALFQNNNEAIISNFGFRTGIEAKSTINKRQPSQRNQYVFLIYLVKSVNMVYLENVHLFTIIINQNQMATSSHRPFLNPQLNQHSSHEELSYSTMVKDLDAAEDQQSQVQVIDQQPSNIHFSHKNTPNQADVAVQPQGFNTFKSLRANTKIGMSREEALKNYPIPAVKPHQEEKPPTLDSYGINSKLEQKKTDDGPAIRHSSNSCQNYLAPAQIRNCQHKALGQRIIDSRIINAVSRSADTSDVDENSVILAQKEQEESIMHFQPAKFDTSEESEANQFQQQKANQPNIVITISQRQANKKQFNVLQKQPSVVKQDQQANYSYLNDSKQQNKKQQQKRNIIYNHMQGQQEIASFKKPTRNNNDIEVKTNNVKNYSSKPNQKDIPIQSRKSQINQKNKVRIDVANRMKSTYDPTGKNTQFKLANGGNLSQPDQRQSKVQRAKKEIQLFEESESEAQKIKKIQYENMVGVLPLEGKKAKNQNLQQAIMMKLETMTKHITQGQDMTHLRKEQLEDNTYRKPSMHKIEVMKNLAPEQLFNGFSSVQTNQKDKRQDFNKQRHGQLSSMIVQQIEHLKKKIKQLQKVSTKRQSSRDQFKLQRVNSDKNNFSTRKISINYKDYNQTSLARVINKKNTSVKKDLSSSISFSEDQFFELQALMSLFKKTPKPDNTPEELADLSLNVLEKLGIHPDQYGYMDLTRFRQGVQFELNEGPTLIWYYDGLMYVGQTRNKRQGILQMQGEGILVIPNVSCYKGMFSKDKKHGFGLYLNNKGEKYKGDWKNDNYHGKGRLNSELSVYEGYFLKGMKHGQGVEYFPNGDIYEGEYEDGDFHGKGRYCWKNKTTYVGQFRMGYMEGQGLWRSKKDSYQGQYYRNMKHGYGIYRWGNGKVYEGKFEHGHRVSKKNPKKPIIAVQKQITCDMDMSDQSDSEIYEVKLNQNGFKIGRRFTIESRQESPQSRKRGSKFNLVKP